MMKVQGIMGVLGPMLVVMMFVLVTIKEVETKSFLINCGTNSSITVDGRKWVGDLALEGNNVTLSSPGIVTSTLTITRDSVYAPLYQTARIFTRSLNYTIRGIKGDCFLRIHFDPFPFENHNVNDSSFAVEANGLKLVSEFNVPGEISRKKVNLQNPGGNLSVSSLVKEFFFSVNDDAIVVEFIPTKGSFGFVNAIEIVGVADKMFDDLVHRVGTNGASTSLNLSKRGIETMYRLNAGGPTIKPNEDSDLRRMWEVDSGYMINKDAGSEIHNHSDISYASPNDTSVGPLLVYTTARSMSNMGDMENRFNMSWKLEVDPGFDYLVRLHFCELVYDKANQRVFRVYIDNQTAADNFDVFVKAGGLNKAFHIDYFDVLSSKTSTLWIQLGPDTSAVAAGTDAFLNGLEIFKLSRNGNLAHTDKFENSGGRSKKTSKSFILWLTIGAGIASVAVLAALIMLLVFIGKKRKQSEKNSPGPGWKPLHLHASVVNNTNTTNGCVSVNTPGRTGRRFMLAEIRAATNNFDDCLVIGVGGFGKVYKGEIEEGMLVAIKRANPQSEQGLNEFETEIEMLSRLRHRHLVSMIGFCDEQKEMILVYEYMANGTLRSHLFGSVELEPLSWKQRLEICIGAARGLHYLHTGADRGIIHRDVKTTNILLDENFVAKMADFGLSKTGPAFEHTHVSTAVKGSFGYLDPEYFRRQQLTEKSDVYSFGVVLFEVVCARPVINPTLPRDQINLAEWAMRWQRQRSLETIIDPKLKGKYCKESLLKFGEIAEKCLADEGKSRPTMGEVLWHLEYALQVQEAWLHANTNTNTDANTNIEVGESSKEEAF